MTSYLPTDPYVPAIGQGAIGVECLSLREDLWALLRPLNHTATERCVLIEREVNALLGGSCHVPIAAYCREQQGALWLDAMVGTTEGERVDAQGHCAMDEDGIAMAHAVVDDLLSKGAATLLDI